MVRIKIFVLLNILLLAGLTFSQEKNVLEDSSHTQISLTRFDVQVGSGWVNCGRIGSRLLFNKYFSTEATYGNQIKNYIKISDQKATFEIDNLRKLYIYSGLGLLEFFQFGIGYQINKDFSISMKYAATWLSYGGSYINPGIGSGFGIAISYYKNLWLFNKISSDYIYYTSLPIIIYDAKNYIRPKGSYYEITIGNEKIESKTGLQIFWFVGIGISYPHRSEILILPSIKIGVSQSL